MNKYFKLSLLISSTILVQSAGAEGTQSSASAAQDKLYQQLEKANTTNAASINSMKKETVIKERVTTMNGIAREGKANHEKDVQDAAREPKMTAAELAEEAKARKEKRFSNEVKPKKGTVTADSETDSLSPTSPSKSSSTTTVRKSSHAGPSRGEGDHTPTQAPVVAGDTPEELSFPGAPTPTSKPKKK